MKVKLPKPPKMPKSWFKLPEYERKAITDLCEETVNQRVDHEEAILQKRWLKIACIVLHRQKDPYGKMRCMAFLKDFKRMYVYCSRFKSGEEIEAWLTAEMEKIFGKDGYPTEWVDALENGGSQ